MTDSSYVKAPPGFTPEQWSEFNENGFITIQDALSEGEVDHYLNAIAAFIERDPDLNASEQVQCQNIVETDTAFVPLIDHPRHIGFAYDVYGEQLKLHLSQFMTRPKDSWSNKWHFDGARGLPYTVFSPTLPLQLKISYWLTDLPEPEMGNLVLLPGSHQTPYLDAYHTYDSVEGEHIVCVRKGAISIMHCSIWHRVEINESDTMRKNIFMTYCPSWVTNQDRILSDEAWLKTLSREQRIIMRSYKDPYQNAKPPAEDFPLYLDRETGLDRDPGMYRKQVGLEIRKRKILAEK